MPPTTTTPGAGGWRITGQSPTTRADDAGRISPGMLVMFVTPSGVNGEVFVSDRDYTADSVRARIAARVAQIEAVQALTGQ